MSGKQKRKERNKAVRNLPTMNTQENNLASGLPKISGPVLGERHALARISN
ncbi:unnamed protein product [Mucor hiemalis]